MKAVSGTMIYLRERWRRRASKCQRYGDGDGDRDVTDHASEVVRDEVRQQPGGHVVDLMGSTDEDE